MKEKELIGKVVQAVGPVIDVRFPDKHLPALLTALKITLKDGKTLTCEVMQHIGDDTVRSVAMGATEGVERGMEAVDTEAPISVPVGPCTLGRMFNVLGEPIDDLGGDFSKEELRPASKSSTSFAHTPKAARSAYSVALVLAKPFSSKS